MADGGMAAGCVVLDISLRGRPLVQTGGSSKRQCLGDIQNISIFVFLFQCENVSTVTAQKKCIYSTVHVSDQHLSLAPQQYTLCKGVEPVSRSRRTGSQNRKICPTKPPFIETFVIN